MQIIKKSSKSTTYSFVSSYQSPGDDYVSTDNAVVKQEDFPEVFAEHGHQWIKYRKFTVSSLPVAGSWRAPIKSTVTGKILIPSQGNNYMLQSTDNKTYTQVAIGSYPYANYTSIGFVNGKFILRNEVWDERYLVVSSDDGATWTYYNLPSAKNWNKVVYINGIYFVAASDANYILYGTNLASLTTSSAFASKVESINKAGDYLEIYVGTSDVKYRYYTTDGINYITVNNVIYVHYTVCGVHLFNNKKYINNAYCLLEPKNPIDIYENDSYWSVHPYGDGCMAFSHPLEYDNIYYAPGTYNGNPQLLTINKYDDIHYTAFDIMGGTGNNNNMIVHWPSIENNYVLNFFCGQTLCSLTDTYDMETEFRLPYIKNGWIKKE